MTRTFWDVVLGPNVPIDNINSHFSYPTIRSNHPTLRKEPTHASPTNVVSTATHRTLTSSEGSKVTQRRKDDEEMAVRLPSLFGVLPVANTSRIENQAILGMHALFAPGSYNATRPLPFLNTPKYIRPENESVVRTSGHPKRAFDSSRLNRDNTHTTDTSGRSGVSANAMARRIDGIYKAMGNKNKSGTATTTKKKVQHICKECGKSFKRETFLKKHRAAVHLKIKPYACSVCDKRFGYKCVRDKHTRVIHLKEKPVVCMAEGCERRFSERGNMLKHYRNIHETDES